MIKKELRILYKQKRQNLTVPQIEKLEDLMLIQFQKLPIHIGNHIMTYAPITAQKEYNPMLVEDYCFFKNPTTQLIYPVANFTNNTMQVFLVDENSIFETNNYGIDEPTNATAANVNDIDIMFIPLLCFNANGYRVGYGKGFYDNFIEICNPNTIKIGFSFFDADVIDDVNTNDKKLDFCVTPYTHFSF